MDDHGLAEERQKIPIDPTLVSNFTHQIINPLNGVAGTLSNLLDGTIDVDRREQRLRTAQAQLQNTIDLVRNLAYMSQLSTDAGRQALMETATMVSIPEVAIEAAQFLQELAEKRGIRIRVRDPDTQFTVRFNKDLLRQVFVNLFDNAVKYSDPGSEILFVSLADEDRLLVRVENTGIMFSEEEASRLFLLGMRGEKAQGKTASGSGLGLYICKELLELYEASVRAGCRESAGFVRIEISFPRFVEDRDRTRQQRERSRSKGRVDD